MRKNTHLAINLPQYAELIVTENSINLLVTLQITKEMAEIFVKDSKIMQVFRTPKNRWYVQYQTIMGIEKLPTIVSLAKEIETHLQICARRAKLELLQKEIHNLQNPQPKQQSNDKSLRSLF